ncbi:hypothetical protein QR680_014306 [Steinernema hermaphroditum]|uniref:RH1 domain-containing protein n=1 Tax=Steinernema hermaphroditum TaxID=289476 RepID=A0AA39I8F3_9BILA|nr:hypothetical protein QR680_014306 [Steinernema hermaphroditum]
MHHSNSGEIVYGGASNGSDDTRVMSEKVQTLAAEVYKEFESIIHRCGQDSVKNLMPLVVSVLESLDLAYLEKEECSVDLEMLKEDNEQLLNQYEREKTLRKSQDQKCLEIEDAFVNQNKELEAKIESLESIVRMLELKAKNSFDHANRLEEREADQKQEFDKLHERYNDLLRTHIEHMERTKYLMGTDKFDMMQSLPLPPGSGSRLGMTTSVDTNVRGISDLIACQMSQSTHVDVNLANHISNEVDWQDEFGQNPADDIQSPRDEPPPLAQSPPLEKGDETGQDESAPDGEHTDDPLCADLTGMGKEVENLIKENTELLETKNALNIVKNDLIAQVDQLNSEHDIFREEIRSLEMVKNKMSERIRELEAEIREMKEKHNKEEQDEQGDEVPMAQRKRFTRQEMARVLMERNYYKEKLMELQDTVKFAESQRARKIAAQHVTANKKGGIWDFFSGLFSAENPNATPTSRRRPQSTASETRKRNQAKAADFVDPDRVNEKRMQERREQYRAVSEHVRKENNNRTHAYGWSIPNTVDTSSASTIVPVPIYCRPVLDHEPNLKIWCADSVSLTGGRTKDGGFIVGDSVFYSDPPESREPTPPMDQTVELLDFELRQQQRDHKEYEEERCDRSSLIWVGSSNQGRSHVAVLDANVANKVLDVFHVCNSHLLCISSVPGVREYDYPAEECDFSRQGGYVLDVPADLDDHANLGIVEFVTMKEEEATDGIPTYSNEATRPSISSATPSVSSVSPQRSRDFSINEAIAVGTSADLSLNSISDLVREKVLEEPEKEAAAAVAEDVETAEEAKSDVYVVNVDNSYRLLEMGQDRFDARKAAEASNSKGFDALPNHIKAGLCKYEGLGTITTALPTMWMGSQDEYIYIHSAVSEWRRCLRKIKMPDAVLDIRHYKGHVFAALANGTVAVFTRDAAGNWSDEGYHVITIGKVTSSVRHLAVVAGKIWAAYRNCVVVISPQDLTIEKVFVAHPRRDSQVRNMQWVGDGVWISIRLDSTLRLYHAHTYQHLQDVDIDPYVTKMLGTSKLDFSYVRPTGLLVANNRLWIGTGTGVIISVPLNDKESKTAIKTPTKSPGPGGVVRVYSDQTGDKVSVGTSFVPYCNLTQAQLSFHGHKDAVKFFLAVPAGPSSKGVSSAKEAEKTLIVSGGDGYIDFRIGEPNEQPVEEASAESARELSHLIIWETDPPTGAGSGPEARYSVAYLTLHEYLIRHPEVYERLRGAKIPEWGNVGMKYRMIQYYRLSVLDKLFQLESRQSALARDLVPVYGLAPDFINRKTMKAGNVMSRTRVNRVESPPSSEAPVQDNDVPVFPDNKVTHQDVPVPGKGDCEEVQQLFDRGSDNFYPLARPLSVASDQFERPQRNHFRTLV